MHRLGTCRAPPRNRSASDSSFHSVRRASASSTPSPGCTPSRDPLSSDWALPSRSDPWHHMLAHRNLPSADLTRRGRSDPTVCAHPPAPVHVFHPRRDMLRQSTGFPSQLAFNPAGKDRNALFVNNAKRWLSAALGTAATTPADPLEQIGSFRTAHVRISQCGFRRAGDCALLCHAQPADCTLQPAVTTFAKDPRVNRQQLLYGTGKLVCYASRSPSPPSSLLVTIILIRTSFLLHPPPFVRLVSLQCWVVALGGTLLPFLSTLIRLFATAILRFVGSLEVSSSRVVSFDSEDSVLPFRPAQLPQRRNTSPCLDSYASARHPPPIPVSHAVICRLLHGCNPLISTGSARPTCPIDLSIVGRRGLAPVFLKSVCPGPPTLAFAPTSASAMAFYPDAQPARGAYHHNDAAFAMTHFPHHDPQRGLPAASAALAPVYPFVDGSGQTHLYQNHAYAHNGEPPAHFEQGVWQAPPQAPRLSAAAARAGRQPMWGYAVPAYGHPPGATAWYAQALAVPHPHQQPRTHQQLEHQLLIQHHMAKAHERQASASIYPSAFGQSAYPPLPNPSHHHTHTHLHQPHHYPHEQQHHARLAADQFQHQYAQPSRGADDSAAHERYADRRHRDSWAGYHRDGRTQAARDWSDWHQTASSHRGSVPYLPHPNQAYPNHAYGPAAHRNSDGAPFAGSQAWTHRDAATGQGWDRASHYARYAPTEVAHDSYHRFDAPNRDDSRYEGNDERFHQSRPSHRDELQRDAYARTHMDGADHWQPAVRGETQPAVPHDDRGYGDARQWQPQHESNRQSQDFATVPTAEDQERAPAENAPDAAAGPPPSSPDSLDKSALPIAAIGAQLIWNACTALFDPDLLAEAHETSDEAMDEDDEEIMSPAAESLPSSSSTPSLNTPDISPWSSTVLERPAQTASSGDWNAFRSPFGPDRLPQMRPQAHSFTFGSDTASNHDDLHRMAVGAERARSALAKDALSAKRSRQGSGHSDALTRHSSGASTASSSEPGTPASIAIESPALSSTISAHSVETARSPLHVGLGMSLDRSRSESAIRSRRSSSKASIRAPSSKWSGRMRENVVAVLRLVSPDWRWSNNDHLFISLSESLSSASPDAQNVRSPNGQTHGRPGRDAVASIITSYANEPSPAFRRFVHQVLAQTLLSPTAFLLGILNALRLLIMAQLPDGSIDPVVLGLFAQPNSAAPFKLFTLGMMIANKHLDDNTFLNKTWNEVTGIPLAELNQTEAWFLKKCNYEVTVPDETWIGFLHRLQTWEEKRSSRGKHRDHESSQRLLLVLDEALGHFDAIPAFRLDGDVTLDAEAAQKAASPMDMWAKSHHRAASLAVLEGGEQHCRSAPAAASNMSHRPQAHEQEPPFAAQTRASHTSRASVAMENPSSLLLRSSSDYLGVGSPFKEMVQTLDGESGKVPNGSMSGPLMPSALLNGSRSLFQHSGMFGPLSTSGWAHH